MLTRGLSILAVLTSWLPAQQGEGAQRAPLVVHEWGTFTSFQGSDGVVLEGLHHEEEGLPDFVHDLGGLDEVAKTQDGPGLKFPASRVTQKMETPVIYFHTEVPRRVKVSVMFVDGLMTQFFPLPEFIAPRLAEVRKMLATSPVDLSKIRLSSVEWDVDLTPARSGVEIAIPEVDPDDPWAEARRVRAAYVSTRADRAAGRGVESERFLFYRGLGRFSLPVRALSEVSGTTLWNDGEHGLPFALAMEVVDGGRGRFRVLGAVAAGSGVSADVDGARWHEPRQLVGALHVTLRRALVARGLYDDEARAMVETWSRQWFLTPGRRVLWIVPGEVVDRNLPLRIEPEPTELVRVLVGRLEFLTPDSEDAIERALLERRSEDAAARARGAEFLVGMGRFLEPKVRRAWARTGSEAVKRSAEELLRELAVR